MLSKINVWRIVRDHVATLRDDRTGTLMWQDLALFFGVPLLVAASLVVLGVAMDEAAVNVLATSLSVFAALLFNLLLLVYDAARKEEGVNPANPSRLKFLKEIYANISFCILVATLSVLALLMTLLKAETQVVRYAFHVPTYYLVSTFVLTLLMVLKRAHLLLFSDFD